MGGSSAINAMIALRGDPGRYEAWGWQDVAAAWDRIELPEERPDRDELGPVNRALLDAVSDAAIAPLTRRHGRRVTAAEAYLWPRWERAGLEVRPETPVRRLCVDGRRAVGVETADGREWSADRVVVAAGAIHTPALLLWSGVDAAGVGAGLQDHPAVSLTLELAEPDLRSGGLAAGALVRRGDLQLVALDHTGADDAGRRHGALMVALMRPRSSGGTVTLGGSTEDPRPVVSLAALVDAHDVSVMRRGVAAAREALRQPAFRDVVDAVYVDEHGTTLEALGDGADLDRWLRSSVSSYLHPTSSCAMGRVVGDDGAVRGYEGLHVCDASVFPHVPDVNTHLPTVMLAERLARRWVG